MKKSSKRRVLFAVRTATMIGAAWFAVNGITDTLGQEKEKSRPVYIATEGVAEATYSPEAGATETQPTETAKATEEPLIASMDWDKDDSYMLLDMWEHLKEVPHKTYRLGRLCYMLAQNRDFVDTLLDNIEQEKVTKMRTAMLTRYPENKEVRGIMKLVNRVEDKKNGYKLTYEAELVEGRTEQQTLQEWLRRENEWQKNRAKASSKSKDAK